MSLKAEERLASDSESIVSKSIITAIRIEGSPKKSLASTSRAKPLHYNKGINAANSGYTVSYVMLVIHYDAGCIESAILTHINKAWCY